ncbi:hypothetical protein HanRHA438_Chr11g0517281 [Helianthus annuus]|nr:hypothetical protein HanIR_Chr11g0543101 [Helianthus annuus]KAJ0871864.1 hypothetical protein HanRHA438_Chr11g0517281 [Helianthus annuus]
MFAFGKNDMVSYRYVFVAIVSSHRVLSCCVLSCHVWPVTIALNTVVVFLSRIYDSWTHCRYMT